MSRFRLLSRCACILFCVTCCVLLPCASTVHEDEAYRRSQFELRMIGQAIRSYHEVNGKLPPAIVRDKAGNPLYSWRVLLLPYLEETNIYEHFHRGEPWDSTINKTLLNETPPCYRSAWLDPEPTGSTRFQVFVGPGTAFERDGLTWNDFPDGLASTILVVEASEPVVWSKPIDLE